MAHLVALVCFLLTCHLPQGLGDDAAIVIQSEPTSSLPDPPNTSVNAITGEQVTNCSDFQFCPHYDYGPHSAYVPCNLLPYDFLECEELIDHKENVTAFELAGIGCLRFGGQHSKGTVF